MVFEAFKKQTKAQASNEFKNRTKKKKIKQIQVQNQKGVVTNQ
jgi:hypothetical protein